MITKIDRLDSNDMKPRFSVRLAMLPQALRFTPNRGPNQRLILEPFDQLGFERPRGGKRGHPPERQSVILCQAFDRVLTQSKKLRDFPQLQPSISTSDHSLISSCSYFIHVSWRVFLRLPKADPKRTFSCSDLVPHLSLDSERPVAETRPVVVHVKAGQTSCLGIRCLSFDI